MQRGLAPIILILAVGLFVVTAVGGYILLSQPQQSVVPPRSNAIPSPAVIQIPFNQILAENCKTAPDPKKSSFNMTTIDPEYLPFTINPDVLPLLRDINGDSIRLNCTSFPYTPIRYNQLRAYVNGDPRWTLLITPVNEEEIRSIENDPDPIIKNSDDIKLRMNLYPSDGHDNTSPGVIYYFDLFGNRIIQLNNGEKLLLAIRSPLIDQGDKRLELLLKDKPNLIEDEVKELTINRLFSDLSKLESPERERIELVEKVLKSISPK